MIAEASYCMHKLALFGKFEFVQKSFEELNIDEDDYGESLFPVHAYTIGINYDLFNLCKTRVAAGIHFTLYNEDKILYNLYGKNPASFEVYLRIYPGLMKM